MLYIAVDTYIQALFYSLNLYEFYSSMQDDIIRKQIHNTFFQASKKKKKKKKRVHCKMCGSTTAPIKFFNIKIGNSRKIRDTQYFQIF